MWFQDPIIIILLDKCSVLDQAATRWRHLCHILLWVKITWGFCHFWSVFPAECEASSGPVCDWLSFFDTLCFCQLVSTSSWWLRCCQATNGVMKWDLCFSVIRRFSFFSEFWKMLKLYKSCFLVKYIFVYLKASESILQELFCTSVSSSCQQQKQISYSWHDIRRVDGCGATLRIQIHFFIFKTSFNTESPGTSTREDTLSN